MVVGCLTTLWFENYIPSDRKQAFQFEDTLQVHTLKKNHRLFNFEPNVKIGIT